MILRTRDFRFTFPRPAMVMGIVNVTPDSFSDGGRFLDPNAAVARAVELAEQGAEILDIGGESSRPNSEPVAEDEELRRVMPVIESLVGRIKIPISIDTAKPAVAQAALTAGASIVNDIGANRSDEAMWEVVARAGAGYVCMHMQGTPRTMQQAPNYADVVSEISEFFSERLRRLSGCGVSMDQTILDVGIGFGKALGHNLELLGSLKRFGAWRRPLLLGVSRKSFMGRLLGAETTARLPASLACAVLAVESGVQIIRAHDVWETVQAVRMAEAILASRNV